MSVWEVASFNRACQQRMATTDSQTDMLEQLCELCNINIAMMYIPEKKKKKQTPCAYTHRDNFSNPPSYMGVFFSVLTKCFPPSS